MLFHAGRTIIHKLNAIGISLINIVVQIFLLVVLFYLMTGGAFLHRWDFHLFLSAHTNLFHLFRFVLALIFLTIVLLAHRKFHLPVKDMEPFKSIRLFLYGPPLLSIGLLCVLFIALHFYSLFFMHEGLMTALWDLGFNDQIIWNTAHGKFLFSSIRGGTSSLAEHFNPALALLAPVYWISNSTNLLFLVQAVICAGSIVAVYLIAKEITGTRSVGIVFATACFLYQPMRSGILFPFHIVTLADPFLLFGFFFLLKRRNLLGLLFIGLALMCKENMILETAGIALYLASQRRRISAVLFVMAFAVPVIMLTSLDVHFGMPPHAGTNKLSYYEHLFNPSWDLWRRVFQPNPLLFLVLVFAPLAFLPFLAPYWYLMLGPTMVMRLLSTMEGFRIIRAHYTCGLNALVFIAAIYGFHRLCTRKTNASRLWIVILLGSSLLFSGIPHLFLMERYIWEANAPENQKIAEMLEMIPSTFSVLATQTFAAHLSHRPKLFVFRSVYAGSLLEDLAQHPDVVAVDRSRIQEREQEDLELFKQQGYDVFFQYASLELYSKPEIELPAELETKLKAVLDSQGIRYRKRIRKWYKLLVIITALIYGIRILSDEKKRYHRTILTHSP